MGPLSPPSIEGHRFILTLVDYATSFPEAIPLKSTTSIDIAEALMSIFSRIGIPREILSDRGPQFTSELMGEVYRLVGVKPLFTTPYHPSCNGRIERQHSILKSILRKLCSLKPKDWNRYLPSALFAMREIPSDTLGFSPFELVYGRQVRGPLAVLHELWANPSLSEEVKTSYQFIFELRNKLEETAEIASSQLKVSSDRYKTYFDKKSSQRKFQVSDEVLVLLPVDHNKLLMSWRGPYKVTGIKNNVDYYVEVDGKIKLYHANLLKKYFRRASAMNLHIPDENVNCIVLEPFSEPEACKVCVLEDEGDAPSEIVTVDSSTEGVIINPDLSSSQRNYLLSIIVKYSDVFSELPGCTSTVTHEIRLSTKEPVRKKVYPVPVHLQKEFDKEVDKLIDMHIIEPSDSPYSSPPVMIKKPDGSYRLAQDYRGINAVTIFDSEPMPVIENELHKFSGAKYISELDITKAYHQIKLNESSKIYTAFPTSKGLMQYTRMPFGLVTAGATYIRLMNKVLWELKGVVAYFDNIYVISVSWDNHLETLILTLDRLREHGLTARPSKCNLGFQEINYLGFKVGNNQISPKIERVKAIQILEAPKTKKQLRSFLGMVSFYRKFLPNLSTVTAKLTDLLRKDVKEPIQWSQEDKSLFEEVKMMLASPPVLMLPDLKKQFCLRTDASMNGMGAVLFQYWDNEPRPVAYASQKFLDREKRYSTVERECLAIIWAINKFQYYLRGQEFILETDHRPLLYLETFKGSNTRLLRWALSLQPYKFKVVYISGHDNHGADLLSRD